MNLKANLVLSWSFLLLVLLKIICFTKFSRGCVSTSSITDHVLVGHILHEKFARDFQACIAACEREERCYSVNYIFSASLCQLNNATRHWYQHDLVEYPSGVYIDILVRTYSPCVDRAPPCSDLCVPLKSFKRTLCVCRKEKHCGYSECKSRPLGMESGIILNNQISASSYSAYREPWKGRLNHRTIWTPIQEVGYQYLDINFRPSVKLITGVAMQGHYSQWWWVKTYKIKYQLASSQWMVYKENGIDKVFRGNKGVGDVSKTNLSNPFEADALRVIPCTFYGRIAIRLELYGC